MFSWEPSLDDERRREARETVMERGRERENGDTHDLAEPDLETVLGMARFLVEDGYFDQVVYDLSTARYRIFDWIAMLLQGRDDGNDRLTQVMASAYIRSNDLEGFVQNLRTHDYQIEEPRLEPIAEGDGEVEMSIDDKMELLETAKTGYGDDSGTPEVKREEKTFLSRVYGTEKKIERVKGLCPACREPILSESMDQDLACEKDNYCGCCGYESYDDELVKKP